MSRRIVAVWRISLFAAALAGTATAAHAQEPAPAEGATREAVIEQAQAEKDKSLHPYVPTRAEAIMDKAEDILQQGGLSWHPFFDSAYSGGGFTLGAGYKRFVSPYNTIDVRGSYTITGYKRIEAEFIAPRLFNRRGSLSLLGGWREATQVGFYGIGTIDVEGRSHQLRVPAAVRLGAADDRAHAPRVAAARRGRGVAVEAAAGRRAAFPRSRPSTRRRRCPAWAPVRPTCTRRAPSASTGARRPATRGAAASTASPSTTTPTATRPFGFQQVDYEAIQHIPILREAWVLSFHGLAADDVHERRSADPVLHAARRSAAARRCAASRSWRFRDRNSLLLQAEWRIMVNRFLDTAFFYDAGKVTARTSDLDFDRPARATTASASAFTDRSPRRCASSLRKSNEGLTLVFSASRLSETASHVEHPISRLGRHASARLRCAARRRRSSLASVRVHQGATLLPRRSDRARAGVAGRVEGAALAASTSLYEMTYNLFVTAGYKPSGVRAQNINTIDEVPDSSWFTNRIGTTTDHGRGDRARPATSGAPPDPSHWVLMREKTVGRASRLHGQGRQGRDLVPRVRSAATSRKARPASVVDRDEALLGARLQPGGVVSDDVRSEEGRVSIRRRPFAGPPARARRSRTDDINASSRTSRSNADGTYRVIAGRLIPGKILGDFLFAGTRPDDPNDLVPHEHRRELRALRVFGAWTNLTDLKAANTLDALVTENGRARRQALPAGRRLDVRHVQRPPRVGSELGALLPGRHDEEAALLVRLRAQPVADGATTSSTRRSASSKAIVFDPRKWRPQTPTTAYMELRDDDAFWAARRVGGVHRRTDPGGRSHRRVQRSGGREVSRRRADQAPRTRSPASI